MKNLNTQQKSTVIFKPLKWIKEDEGTIYAAPKGLGWRYYITPIEDGSFELYFLDNDFHSNEGPFVAYPTISEAQKKASEHYLKTLNDLVLRVDA